MPTQIATGATSTATAYSLQRKLEKLCDGSLLFAYQSAANTVSLVQVTTPSGTPGTTAVSQTFTVSGGTNTVGDIFVLNNGTTTSDVWVAWSDNSATTGLFVAHGTYTASGASWSWDNTSTSIALGSTTGGFMIPSIVWTGSNLIIVTRGNVTNYGVAITSTTTKNGTTGWSTIAFTNDTGSETSHDYAQILHDAANSLSIMVYTVAGDTIYGVALSDATSPTVANWNNTSRRVALSGTTNVGAAGFTAVLDTTNSRLHLAYINTASSTNPQYNTATYTSSTLSAATSFSAGNGGTAAVAAMIGLDAANPPGALILWSTAAPAAAADIMYVKLASPYAVGNLGTVTNLTNNTATDNTYVHTCIQSTMSGLFYVAYSHSVTPWAIEFDNSITAGVAPGGPTLGPWRANAHAEWPNAPTRYTTRPALSRKPSLFLGVDEDDPTPGSTIEFYSDQQWNSTRVYKQYGFWPQAPLRATPRSALVSHVPGYNPTTLGVNENDLTWGSNLQFYGTTDTPLQPLVSVFLTDGGTATESFVGTTATVAITDSGTGTDTVVSPYAPGTGPGSISRSTGTQTANKSGNGYGAGDITGTEHDYYYTDASGSGWGVGSNPWYGGGPISAWYQIDPPNLNTTLPQKTSATGNLMTLLTTQSGGIVHWEADGPGGFQSSELVTFSNAGNLTELAPASVGFRAYIKCIGDAADGNGITWTMYACIYPGDPGLVVFRFDQHNPTGSSISVDESDVQLIASLLTDTGSNPTGIWNISNGFYGTIGGTPTTPWPPDASQQTGTLDYAGITPDTGQGVSLGAGAAVLQDPSTQFSWNGSGFETNVSAASGTVPGRIKFGFYSGVVTSWSIPSGQTNTFYVLRVFKRGLTSTIMAAIAADYKFPGTPTMTTGTYTSFSNDERAYIFAAASNLVTTTLDLTPAHVTVRYKPIVKITGWTGGTPTLTWGGSALVSGTDYQVYNDTTNSILYLQLYFDIVTSGATTGQRNNAALAVTPTTTNINITDSGTGTDSIVVTAAVPLSDSGTGTDTIVIAAAVPLSDSGTGTDTIVVTVPIALADSGVGTDSVAITVAVPLSETGTGTDTVAITATVPLSESGTGTDSVVIAAAVPLADSGTGTDTIVVTVPIPLAESGTGTDTIAITAAVPLSDNGVGSEAVAINAAVPLTDSGTGTDTVVVTTPGNIQVSESGTGYDAPVIVAAIPLADSGVGTETLSIVVAVTLLDAATGADVLAVVQQISATDSGTGSETLSVFIYAQSVIYTPIGGSVLAGGVVGGTIISDPVGGTR